MIRNFGPVIFFCTAIIGLLILYECKKSSRSRQSDKDGFWKREARANTVRRKDITFLNYITIPMDSLPFVNTDDDELLEYHDKITSLSHKKILNLTGYSNTDLKEQYGVANLSALSEYDDNYSTLVNIISRWGMRLITLNYINEAVTVLEYGISIGTDVSRNYYLLADIYRKRGKPEKIDLLIESASGINSIMKSSIIDKLNEMRHMQAK